METASISEERTYNTTRRGISRLERNTSKTRRNTGKSLIMEKGKVVPDRKPIELSTCRLKCAERITTAEQTHCFDRDRRAAFVSKLVMILPKKSQKTGSRTLNRHCYCKYMLEKLSNEKKPVCKEFFVNY
ncbi:unnamed protein product [Euphydryas editha]|uniref:Uncharacterized protein n=1 Tax=Euphydryas editha TaxID=104508 RepID=A0AAU9TN23_EUPED|nr:unnamed protein product [Euphydryas editha]